MKVRWGTREEVALCGSIRRKHDAFNINDSVISSAKNRELEDDSMSYNNAIHSKPDLLERERCKGVVYREGGKKNISYKMKLPAMIGSTSNLRCLSMVHP